MASLSHPYDAVIFDMDGTLLDTEAVFRTIVYDVVAGLGFEMTESVHLSMIGSSHETTQRLLAEAFGVAFPYALFDEQCRTFMRERLHEEVPLKHGAHALVTGLKQRDIPIAVATSSRSPHAMSHLKAAGIIDLFDTIVTRDDVTHPKPHPEPYLLAARRLRVDPVRCIAFEDSHSGVRAAHAAGMRTVMVPDLVHPTEEITALCAVVLETLAHAHAQLLPELEAAVTTAASANASAKHLQVKTKG